jgi:hypothetical protein
MSVFQGGLEAVLGNQSGKYPINDATDTEKESL